MFLTYYTLGPHEHTTTWQYSSRTQPYRAYSYGLDLTRRYSQCVVRMGLAGPVDTAVTSEEQLADLLADIGCTLKIAELRSKRDEIFDRNRQELRQAGVRVENLF